MRRHRQGSSRTHIGGEIVKISHTTRSWALLVPFILIACSSAAQEMGTDGPLDFVADQIDALVVPQAEAELLSGIILVAKGKQILFQRSYGFASRELRVPKAQSTRFGIASITGIA